MSGYGYSKRADTPPRISPATGAMPEALENRTRAPRSAQERPTAGSLDPEIFGDLEKIQETIITPEYIASPEIMAGVVTALEGEFATLSALSANLGEVTAGVVRDADDRIRLDLDNAVLAVRDEFNTSRVVVGRLGAGEADYGLVVYDALGTLILGANGLGTNVVGEDQVQTDAITNTKILNAAVSTAKIANLAVNNAKIANMSVGKLLAGALGIGEYIESTDYAAGSTGWRISSAMAEFNDVTVRGTLAGVSGTFDVITAGKIEHSVNRFIDLSAGGTDPFLRFDDVIFRADGTREWPDEVLNPPLLLSANTGGVWNGSGTNYTTTWTYNSLVNSTDHRIRISYYRDGVRVDQETGLAITATPKATTVAGGSSGHEVYVVVSLTNTSGVTLSSIETQEAPQAV